MKTFTKIAKIYFSPSSTTRKIVDEIANKFEGTQEEYDLLNVAGGNSLKEFDDDISNCRNAYFCRKTSENSQYKINEL